jgi:hypothetical protein
MNDGVLAFLAAYQRDHLPGCLSRDFAAYLNDAGAEIMVVFSGVSATLAEIISRSCART